MLLYSPIFKKAVRVLASCENEEQEKMAEWFARRCKGKFISDRSGSEWPDNIWAWAKYSDMWDKMIPDAVSLCKEGRYNRLWGA